MNRGGVLGWFASNHVVATLMMLFIVGAGLFSLHKIRIEVFPQISSDMITIRVPYLGASPSEAEEGVCLRVEEAIASVEGIKRIRSVAAEGMGTVIVELIPGADNKKVMDDVESAVDRIETFPKETEKPVIAEVTNRRRVISVVISGDVSEQTLKRLAEDARDEILDSKHISQVEFSGVRRNEISIESSEESLRRYGLTFDELSRIVRESSLDLPGGSVKTAGGEILLRAKGQRYRGREFQEVIVLRRPDGTRVRLGEIARVRDDFEDSEISARFDGKPAAMLEVFRVGEEDVLKVSSAAREYVLKKRDAMPAGVTLDTWQDDSEILRSRISLLLRNGRQGLFLIFLCLILFLDLRYALWTTWGILVSFLGALWLIPFMGVSVNMVSLFAFILALGIVVDDAIVVGENIHTYHQQGLSHLDSAIHGVRDIALPVTFTILTTVAAFLPLIFTAGQMGKFMYQIPAVVISILIISLIEALWIFPAHLAVSGRLKPPSLLVRLQDRVGAVLRWVVRGPYARTLKTALEWRYITVAAALVMFMAAVGIVAAGHLKFTFLPKIDSDNMIAALTMPQGTPVEKTRKAVKRLEEAVRGLQEEFHAQESSPPLSIVRHVSAIIGEQPFTALISGGAQRGTANLAAGGHLAEVNVQLLSGERRGIPSTTLLNRWRELTGEIAGASSLTFTATLFSPGSPVFVELSHRNFSTLLKAVEDLKRFIGQYRGTSDIADSFLPGKLEIKLGLKPEAKMLGLTLSDLARQVRQGFYGEEVQRVQRGRDDLRVMLRYPESERRSIADLESMRIRLADGREVPFTTVATAKLGRGYALIHRTDRRRVVSVTADVDEKTANANEINRSLREVVLPRLQEDYPGLVYSFEGQQREQQESMHSVLINFLVAQLGIFGLLALQFRNYSHPLIIMSAVPFGLIGAVIGHLVMGLDLSLMSGFGVVALSGVVVNDSLVMLDLINSERSQGVSLGQVVIDAGSRRFRAILLTSLTTFLGLTPLILERSVQARFLVPMAVSLGFGVLFATAITLLLVPALYMILEDVKRKFMRSFVADAPQDDSKQQGFSF